MGSRSDTKMRADAIQNIEDVYWADNRTILRNNSIYASLPPAMAQNMKLEKGSEYQPGYTPKGQAVVIEEEAIIIRRPTTDNE